jgi:hypothetical protein
VWRRLVFSEKAGGGVMTSLWANVATFLAIALPELAGLMGGV